MNLTPMLKRPICPSGAITGPVKERELKKDYITLNRFINNVEMNKTTTSYQFPQLMMAIQTAVKCVAITLKKCGLAQMRSLGTSEQHFPSLDGRRLEQYLNEVFVNLVASTNTVSLIVCKDSEDAIRVETTRSGKYIFAFSAADSQTRGSLEYSSSVGSTFAVYRKTDSTASVGVDDKDALQAGKTMLCGGYVLYGYCTVMVLAFDGGSVNGFTLDHAVGEFMLTDPNIKIPTSAKLYSVNEGHTHSFDPSLVNFIEKIKVIKVGEIWSARYSGNLVGDCHRILKLGGIYMYPASKEYPNGKHRLLYECCPIAFVFKQAGGLAVNGKQYILDMTPQKFHEKTPFFCGSRDNIMQLMQAVGMTKQPSNETNTE
uniref:fructose-bisphosphatase n=1 Tax=Lygus hesperus TaxID=30085 RepID=A0A0A9X5N3_LYGHE